MRQANPARLWVTTAALLGLLWASDAARAEYYQWRDAQGRLHFGQQAPPEALDVQRRGVPEGADSAPASEVPEPVPAVAPPPAAAAHAPFAYEDPAGRYRVRFPDGWDALPEAVVAQLWGESMASRIDAAFYYDTDPDQYLCPCALIAAMPAGDEDALVASRYESLPLGRGLGADPVAATGPRDPPVVYFDPAGGQFWFRQEATGADGGVNATLTTMLRTHQGGVMVTVVQPRATLAAYTDAVLPVVASLEPIGEVAPPPAPRALRHSLIAISALSVVLLIVGWTRGGPKRALLFGCAPLLSGVVFLLAAAANPRVMEWERSMRIAHLLGLSLGLPVLAFVAALVQKKTRSLDQAMSWYVRALLLCLALYGVNAVRVVAERAQQPETVAETQLPAAE